jgi:hypothetical protein
MRENLFDLTRAQRILILTYIVGLIAQTITLYILDPDQFNMAWFVVYFVLTILTTISYYKLFMSNKI